MIEAYPLCWPMNRARTPKEKRQFAKFSKKVQDPNYSWKNNKSLSVDQSVTRISVELDRFTKTGKEYRVTDVVISTNLPTRKDGMPYSSSKNPEDPGVAVYFTLDGLPYCLPCDKWNTVAGNLAAVAAHLSALRGIERWGVGEMHDVFTGYKAIPEKAGQPNCWDILGIPPTKNQSDIHAAYRLRAKSLHPDTAEGDASDFIELSEVRDQAIKLSLNI